jgi:CHAD domain-containing protein
MQSWRDAALDWTDPEGVHSMRVASRRLRSTLRDFAPYLHKRRLGGTTKQLKNLADTLGEVRDHDVALLALEELKTLAPPELSAALGQFIETRAGVREQSRKKLTAAIETAELKHLETKFISALDHAIAAANRPKKQAHDKPALTFAEMSRTIILDRLKEFEKRSDGIFKPLDVDALHDMRIAVKRFRYALELFSKCWPRTVAAQAKRVARIQGALGDLHDCDVWIESFGKQIIRARKQKDKQQVAVLLWLLGHFVRARTRHLHRVFARWREWETQDAAGKLRAALEPAEPPEPPEPSEPSPPAEPAAEPSPEPPLSPQSQPDQAGGEQIRQGL